MFLTLLPVFLTLSTTVLVTFGVTSLTLLTVALDTFLAASAAFCNAGSTLPANLSSVLLTDLVVTTVAAEEADGLLIFNICFLISAALAALTLVVVALPSTPARNSPLAVFIVSPGFAVCTAFLVVVVVAFATVLIPVGGIAASFGVGISAVFF